MKCIQIAGAELILKAFKALKPGEVVLNSSKNLCLVVKPYNCSTGKQGLVKLETGEFYEVCDTYCTKYEVVDAQLSWKRKQCT